MASAEWRMRSRGSGWAALGWARTRAGIRHSRRHIFLWYRLIRDLRQNAGDFEDGSIFDAGYGGPVSIEGLEHFFYCRADVTEVGKDFANSLVGDPLGVVTLLGEGPGVAFDDYGEFHGYGFADAAGAGLAYEEIGEMHEIRDLGGESFYVMGGVFSGAQF